MQFFFFLILKKLNSGVHGNNALWIFLQTEGPNENYIGLESLGLGLLVSAPIEWALCCRVYFYSILWYQNFGNFSPKNKKIAKLIGKFSEISPKKKKTFFLAKFTLLANLILKMAKT